LGDVSQHLQEENTSDERWEQRGTKSGCEMGRRLQEGCPSTTKMGGWRAAVAKRGWAPVVPRRR